MAISADNPLADLLPAQQRNAVISADNPLADLLPQQQQASPLSKSLFSMQQEPQPVTREYNQQGAMQGLRDAYQGAKQRALQLGEVTNFNEPGTAQAYTDEVNQQRAQYESSPAAQYEPAQWARIGANAVPYIATTPISPYSSLTKAGAAVNALGGSIAGGLQFAPSGENSDNLINAAYGGAIAPVVGAGIEKGFEGLGRLGAKAYNTIKGRYANPETQAIVETGAKHNVPVYVPDVTDSRAIKTAGTALEDVPFIGMQKERAVQMQAAENAARNVVGDAEDQMINAQFGGRNGLKQIQEIAEGRQPSIEDTPTPNAKSNLKRLQKIINQEMGIADDAGSATSSAANSKRTKAAQDLLEQINNAGDDWNKIIEASGNTKLFRAKLIADKKYAKVAQMADQYGPVDTSDIIKAVDNMIQQENKGVLKNEGLIKTLSKIKEGLFEQAPPVPGSTILDETGKPFIAAQASKTAPKKLTYSQLRQFRSDLSDEISGYFTGPNAAIGKKGVGNLQALKQQTDNTLNRFAQTNGPDLKTVWKNADNFYRTAVIPYKDRQLAQALKGGNPDEIYGKFIKTGEREGGKGTSRALRFYNALDNKGKAAVKYGMVSDAFEKAYNGDTKKFSPAIFASDLDKKAAAKGVFFQGQDKLEIDGFKNLMRHIERARQALDKPDTGVKAVPWIVGSMFGAGIALDKVTTGALTGATYATKKLLTTEAGRRFLLSSSKLQPGSPAMQTLVNKISQTLQAGAQKAGILGAVSQTKTEKK